jgi:cell division inhibitor SulA
LKLRNAHLAAVDQSKVVDYLMNGGHPDNGGKAQFFESLGFSRKEPEHLMTALRAVAADGDIVESTRSAHGEKHVVDGWLSAHTEQANSRLVRTVWIIDAGSEIPRLVTAYPGRE